MTYNTPQRCEICDGEFKKPHYKKFSNYHIVCNDCLEYMALRAIRRRESGKIDYD